MGISDPLDASYPSKKARSVPQPSRTDFAQNTVGDNGGNARSDTGRASPTATAHPELSDEQLEIEQLVLDGQNVFFTGNAGTGKSFLLNRIITRLQERYGARFGEAVAITAATGIAATHINGTTFHSALGCGVPRVYKDFGKMWNGQTPDRIRRLEVLILDETSMVSAELFEQAENQARAIRHNERAFGGIQVVLCGDFFQLPPIETRWTPNLPRGAFLNRGFTFQSPAWQRCRMELRLLTKVWRQADPAFVRILDAVRGGDGEWAVRELVQKCSRPLPVVNGVEPTELFARNASVDQVNSSRLAGLPGQAVVIPATDEVELHPELMGKLSPAEQAREIRNLERNEFFNACLAPKTLELKVEAQVMLLKNLELGTGSRMLVNGSRGVVTRFVDKQAHTEQLQADVAELQSQNQGRQMSSTRNIEIAKQQATVSSLKRMQDDKLPVVQFLNGREEIMVPETFSSEVHMQGTCKRTQVPLKLAWALTIHKCQGMTLDRAKVSLKGIFAEGQAYVCLSRVRSLDGLQILDYSPDCVKTSKEVKAFYECLARGEEYMDTAWDDWQQLHPSSAPAATVAGQGGDSMMSQHNAADMSTQQYESAPAGAATQERGGYDCCFKCGQPGHWARDCPGRVGPGRHAAHSGFGGPSIRSEAAPSFASHHLAPTQPVEWGNGAPSGNAQPWGGAHGGWQGAHGGHAQSSGDAHGRWQHAPGGSLRASGGVHGGSQRAPRGSMRSLEGGQRSRQAVVIDLTGD